jgi:hypothetical protein
VTYETTGTRRIEIKLGRNVLQMILSQINVLMKKAEIKENISQTP